MQSPFYLLKLTGVLQLSGPDGSRVDIRSKKAIALLALLATSDSGERTRTWLQDMLWGSREPYQAQTSLRRELFNLRKLTEPCGLELISANSRAVRLRLDHVKVDWRGDAPVRTSAAFLEGLEIAGEPAFATWLQTTRAAHADNEHLPAPPANKVPFVGKGVALLMLPFTLAGTPDAEAEMMLAHAFQGFIEFFGRSRYFTFRVLGSPDVGADPAAVMEAVAAANARFALLGQIIVRNGHKSFAMVLMRGDDSRVVWSGSTSLPNDEQGDEFWLVIQRSANRTLRLMFQEECRRGLGRDPAELELETLICLARQHVTDARRETFEKARLYIDEALKRFPEEASALDAVYQILHSSRYGRASGSSVWLRSLAQRAMRADPSDVSGVFCAAVVEYMLGRLDLAIAYAEAGLEMSPAFIEGHAHLGYLYLLDGQLERGRAILDRALLLSPTPWLETHALKYLALYHALVGEFQDAVDCCIKASIGGSEGPLVTVVRIYVLVRTGRIEAAQRLIGGIDRDQRLQVILALKSLKFADKVSREQFRQALVMAIRRSERRAAA